jgi:hypothetical protein
LVAIHQRENAFRDKAVRRMFSGLSLDCTQAEIVSALPFAGEPPAPCSRA